MASYGGVLTAAMTLTVGVGGTVLDLTYYLRSAHVINMLSAFSNYCFVVNYKCSKIRFGNTNGDHIATQRT